MKPCARLLAVLMAMLLAPLLAACSALPTPTERRDHANALAAARHWQTLPLVAGDFTLLSYVPPRWEPGADLTVYLEGDGLAWLDGAPSADPTPRDPLALRLALAQDSGNAAYLARACQYQAAPSPPCLQRYWTSARFAPDVIAASNRALDILKATAGARHLTLVGYSGGGAIAVLLAAQRCDVKRLITVAGNLDHAAWTRLHALQPLHDSLNPAAVRAQIAHLPQVHFTGAKDSNMPPRIALHFAAGFPADSTPKVKVVDGYNHDCCWAEAWTQLMLDALLMTGPQQ